MIYPMDSAIQPLNNRGLTGKLSHDIIGCVSDKLS